MLTSSCIPLPNSVFEVAHQRQHTFSSQFETIEVLEVNYQFYHRFAFKPILEKDSLKGMLKATQQSD